MRQTELFNPGLYQKPEAQHKPIYDSAWDLCDKPQSTCKSVGGQVETNTKKAAPQHEKGFTHWIEKYWVERVLNKYWYFRYVYKYVGGRRKKVYLGSVSSPKAKRKRDLIYEAIEIQKLSPDEIIELLNSLKGKT